MNALKLLIIAVILNGAQKKRLDFSIAAALRSSRKKHPAPNRRCGWLETEAGAQSDDTGAQSSSNCAEV